MSETPLALRLHVVFFVSGAIIGFNIRVTCRHPGLRSVVVRLCPNLYHTSEYVLDRL